MFTFFLHVFFVYNLLTLCYLLLHLFFIHKKINIKQKTFSVINTIKIDYFLLVIYSVIKHSTIYLKAVVLWYTLTTNCLLPQIDIHPEKFTLTAMILSHELLLEEQKSDSVLQDVLKDTSLKLQKLPVPFSHKKIYFNITLESPSLCIPPKLRSKVFQHLHGILHLSKRTTLSTSTLFDQP